MWNNSCSFRDTMIETATVQSIGAEDWELLMLVIQGLEATDLKHEAGSQFKPTKFSSFPFFDIHYTHYTQVRLWNSPSMDIVEDSDTNGVK